MLERGRRHVVAFVGDHQPVPACEGRNVGAAGRGLQGDDVDGAFDLLSAAAELAWLDPEMLVDAAWRPDFIEGLAPWGGWWTYKSSWRSLTPRRLRLAASGPR